MVDRQRAVRGDGSRTGRGPLAASVSVLAVLGLLLTGCTSDGTAAPTDDPSAAQDVSDESGSDDGTVAVDGAQRFPDIVDAILVPRDDGTFDVEVTVSSPYDTAQRYADGWRVLAPDGEVLGVHTLAHDHANEQPFTRTQRGLVVPDGVAEVTVEGRDQQYGFGGGTVVVAVPAP